MIRTHKSHTMHTVQPSQDRVKEIRLDMQTRPLKEIVEQFYAKTYTKEEIEQALSGCEFSVKMMPKLSFVTDRAIEREFRGYLNIKGYSPNTADSYVSAIRQICQMENISRCELYNDINIYVLQYKIGGKKENLGERGHGTWRNALNRLQDFKNYNTKNSNE